MPTQKTTFRLLPNNNPKSVPQRVESAAAFIIRIEYAHELSLVRGEIRDARSQRRWPLRLVHKRGA